MKRILFLIVMLSILIAGCVPQSMLIQSADKQWDQTVYSALADKAMYERQLDETLSLVSVDPTLILDQRFIFQIQLLHGNAVAAGNRILETAPPLGRYVEYEMFSEALPKFENAGYMLVEAMQNLDSDLLEESYALIEEYNDDMNLILDYLYGKQSS